MGTGTGNDADAALVGIVAVPEPGPALVFWRLVTTASAFGWGGYGQVEETATGDSITDGGRLFLDLGQSSDPFSPAERE